MNKLKIVISVMFIVSLLMAQSISFAANKAAPKTQFTKKTYNKSKKPQPAAPKTKEYKVPGSAVIGYSKQHGYEFYGFQLPKKTKPSACQFMGSHWQIGKNESCRLEAFLNWGPAKCNQLRKGWKIKNVEIKGDFRWDRSFGRPVNTTKTRIIFKSSNNSRKMYPVSIKFITLVGPEGPFKKWQEAFNHCTDSNYRP